MMWDQHDTIAAIASASGGALRGIVRLSGPQVLRPLATRFRAAEGVVLESLTEPTAVGGELDLDGFASALPCRVYYWPDRRSYTREPVVEIHTVGSPPLLEAVLQQLCAAGARPAAPGEFTLRAFLAGRLDLTQAEAVLGMIDAQSDSQFQTALAQMAGGLSRPLAALREQLLELLAHLEAGLDFVEEDIEFISAAALLDQLSSAACAVELLQEQMTSRSQARQLPRVVLYGWPNAGKSSLLNRLANSEAALVSPLAGTTRDYLEVDLNLSDLTCRVVDTAGIESHLGDASIAASAQRLAELQRSAADLNVLCLDATRPLNDWELAELAREPAGARLIVFTKCDDRESPLEPLPAVATSALTGRGIEALKQRLRAMLVEAAAADAATVTSTALRCEESLRLAAESLRRAVDIVNAAAGEELVAAEVRIALVELGKVAGGVYTDDVLDRIFSRFCIGK